MANNRKQRITPDSITDNQIKPVATPVNKLQTFRPDLSEAQKSKQTYGNSKFSLVNNIEFIFDKKRNKRHCRR